MLRKIYTNSVRNNIPKSRIFCEPQLSKRGLYETLSLKIIYMSQKNF